MLFNDEKVVEAPDVEEMKKTAYIYFFKRAWRRAQESHGDSVE